MIIWRCFFGLHNWHYPEDKIVKTKGPNYFDIKGPEIEWTIRLRKCKLCSKTQQYNFNELHGGWQTTKGVD